MKKFLLRRKEEAVSPVIATILMVAITVVLAAVLYVMVIGFGTIGGSTPAGAWIDMGPLSSTEGKLTSGAFTADVAPLDIKIFVTVNQSACGFMAIPSNTDDSPQTITWAEGKLAGYSATYFDYNPASGEITSGDYITLSGLDPGTLYSFEVFHIPTESTITMTGDGPSFNTP